MGGRNSGLKACAADELALSEKKNYKVIDAFASIT
jgi:hypothetical protein